ncbi:hypothetical protein IAT40_005951 [Kwoniella sp. CBS 6097]
MESSKNFLRRVKDSITQNSGSGYEIIGGPRNKTRSFTLNRKSGSGEGTATGTDEIRGRSCTSKQVPTTSADFAEMTTECDDRPPNGFILTYCGSGRLFTHDERPYRTTVITSVHLHPSRHASQLMIVTWPSKAGIQENESKGGRRMPEIPYSGCEQREELVTERAIRLERIYRTRLSWNTVTSKHFDASSRNMGGSKALSEGIEKTNQELMLGSEAEYSDFIPVVYESGERKAFEAARKVLEEVSVSDSRRADINSEVEEVYGPLLDSEQSAAQTKHWNSAQAGFEPDQTDND